MSKELKEEVARWIIVIVIYLLSVFGSYHFWSDFIKETSGKKTMSREVFVVACLCPFINTAFAFVYIIDPLLKLIPEEI